MAYEVNTGGSGGAKKKPNTWEELIQGYSERSGNEGYYDEFGYHQAPAPWITEQPQPQPEPIEPEQPEETTPAQTTAEKKKEEEPIVEPVTEEKKQEEETPVVQPTRSASFVDEDTEARRNVPPEETASQLFQDWTNLVEQNEPDDEGWFYQQEPERGGNLVTPVGYKGSNSNSGTSNSYYGTNGRTEGETSYVTATPQPAYSDADIDGAIQFMRNELGIMEFDPVYERDYAEQLLADNAVPEAYLPAQVQEQTPTPEPEPQRLNPSISDFDLLMEQPVTAQPEMLFPTDYGGNTIPEIPAVSTPVVVGQTRAPGIGTGAGVGPIAQDPSYLGLNTLMDNLPKYGPDPIANLFQPEPKPSPSQTSVSGDPLREAIDRVNAGDLRTTDITRGRPVDNTTETPVDITDVDPSRRFETGSDNTPTEQSPFLFNEQYLTDRDLGLVDDSFTPEELAELYGAPVESETWDGTTGTPRTSGYERAERNSPVVEEPGAFYDALADLINANESDGWRTAQASDLYGALPRIDPNTPGAEILEQQRRDRMDALMRQIEADDELRDERPKVTGQDVKDAIDRSQNDTRDFLYDLFEPVTDTVTDWATADNTEYTGYLAEAQEAALNAGYLPGTPESENFIRDYINSKQEEPTPETSPETSNVPSWISDVPREERNPELGTRVEQLRADYFKSLGYNDQIANYLAKNPDSYRVNPDGRISIIRQPQIQTSPYTQEQLLNTPGLLDKVWRDRVGTDRLMDDLMQMDAPAVLPDGSLNTAAQAMFMGMNTDGTGEPIFNKDQFFHLFDRGGKFASPESGLNIDPSFASLIASDTSHAYRNFNNKDYPNLTETVYAKDQNEYDMWVDSFIKANPLIRAALDAKLITMDDIKNNFFKNVIIGSGKGSGSGYGSGYRGYGGGGGGGSYGGGYGYNSPTAKKQDEQRINNIMKNWAF